MQGETTSTSVSTETVPETHAHAHHRYTSTLFHHEARPHQPRNVNEVHDAEKEKSGLNQKIAIGLTKGVGTMICAYIFAILAIVGFPGFSATPTQYVQWTSQTFIQLVMLSVIMVGQSVLGRKQELQADEQFNTTVSTYHDIEQIMHHLSVQDEELVRIGKLIVHLLEKNGVSLDELAVDGTNTSHLIDPLAQPAVVSSTPTPPALAPSENHNA